jgi:phage terminase Nu1 subunit (DNA packaging protein)
MRVNRTELAEILGKSMPTITAWIGEGMEYVEGGGKGKPFVFETVDAILWAIENGKFRRQARAPVPGTDPFAEAGDAVESYDEAERRKMVAQADSAELALAKAAGRVVEIVDVGAAVAEMNVTVRTRLLGLGNKVRVRVGAYLGGDKAAIEGVVKEVEEVVSDAMAEIRDDPFAEVGDEVSAEADGQP